jgi:hypothetical protein
MSVILATQEAEIRGSDCEASPGKYLKRPYLENTQCKKGLLEWLK